MYTSIGIRSSSLPSKAAAAKLAQAAQEFCSIKKHVSFASPVSYVLVQQGVPPQRRNFTSTPRPQLEAFPPPVNAPNVKVTAPAWRHPVYTEEQMNSIIVAHREAKTWSDKVALTMVRILRWGMDFCTGYSHNDANPAATKDKKKHWTGHFSPMDERKWMIRIVFLESVAGVPGMVAGMLRHFHSLRRLERDNGWIETLLEEAYNERMHLLTFLTLAKPGIFMRLMLLGAQGVFFNALVASYLVSPRTCHRFVGYLEEEAVLTYTRCIDAIDAGALPMFKTSPAPEIAIKYWKMPEGKRTLRDLMLYVRADEAKHREVNHTLGNLVQRGDPNPFVSEYKEGAKGEPEAKRPGKGIDNIKATGWEREEVL